MRISITTTTTIHKTREWWPHLNHTSNSPYHHIHITCTLHMHASRIFFYSALCDPWFILSLSRSLLLCIYEPYACIACLKSFRSIFYCFPLCRFRFFYLSGNEPMLCGSAYYHIYIYIYCISCFISVHFRIAAMHFLINSCIANRTTSTVASSSTTIGNTNENLYKSRIELYSL